MTLELILFRLAREGYTVKFTTGYGDGSGNLRLECWIERGDSRYAKAYPLEDEAIAPRILLGLEDFLVNGPPIVSEVA